MNFRIASALFALALPLAAQEPVASEVEAIFYKAFYLERGQRDHLGAMSLYEQFLAKAPEHKLAQEAAMQTFNLLERLGKTKERDEFKAKYGKLLGNVANAPARPPRAEGAGGEDARPGRGQRGPGGAGGEAGPGGQRGGMRGGLFGLMRGETKIADMSDEQIQELKDGVAQSGQMIDRFREVNPEMADKLEKSVGDLKKALDAGNKEDAQKAMDALRASMPQRGQRGAGGGGQRGGGQRGGGGGGQNGGGQNGGGGGGGI